MTTWPTIRATLVTAIAAVLDCEEDLVRWSTDAQPVNDLQARLSVVSDVQEGGTRREVDPDDYVVTLYEAHRLQIEVLIETSGGEYPENTTDAQTLAQRARIAFQHDTILEALKEAGIVLVTEPGPIRPVSYEDRETTYWICARAFELPLRVTFEYSDPDYTITPMVEVIGDGTVDEEENRVVYDVEDPS